MSVDRTPIEYSLYVSLYSSNYYKPILEVSVDPQKDPQSGVTEY